MRQTFKPINVTTSKILLFDLKEDPFETTNLAENTENAEFINNLVFQINQDIENHFPVQTIAIYVFLMKIFEEFKKCKRQFFFVIRFFAFFFCFFLQNKLKK